MDGQAGLLVHFLGKGVQCGLGGVPYVYFLNVPHPAHGPELAPGLVACADDAHHLGVLPGQILGGDGAGGAGAAAGDPGAVHDAPQRAGGCVKQQHRIHTPGQTQTGVGVVSAGGGLDGHEAAAHVDARLDVHAAVALGRVQRHKGRLGHLAAVEGAVGVLHGCLHPVQVDEAAHLVFIEQ